MLQRLKFAVVAIGIVATPAWAQPEKPIDSQPPLTQVTLPATPPAMYRAVKGEEKVPKSPWLRYFTTDRAGRLITFYVSENAIADLKSPAKLPVVVYAQGSGSQSIFTKVDTPNGPRAGASGGQGQIHAVAKGRVITVIAEKPGVQFLDRPTQPGSAEEASQTFREEHTLDQWAEAVSAAMKAALTLPNADPSKILLVGHSEGGLVACAVAARNPQVTDVACLAGGGPSQLFDLTELARSGVMCGSKPRSPDECVAWLMAQWDDVLKDPQSADKLFLGHPYRRWTTFLETSPIDELRKTKARVFIGQGSVDKAVVPVTADMLYASLKALGRDVTLSKVEGGDHAFMQQKPDGSVDESGWERMHTSVVDWFLGAKNSPIDPQTTK